MVIVHTNKVISVAHHSLYKRFQDKLDIIELPFIDSPIEYLDINLRTKILTCTTLINNKVIKKLK